MESQVTVAIPTLNNRPDLLENILSVLNESGLIGNTIIVNTSKNKINYPKVKVIPANSLLVGKNKALKLVSTKWLVLLDDDIVLDSRALLKFIKYVKSANCVAASPFVYSNITYKSPDYINKVYYGLLSFYKLPSLNENKLLSTKPYKCDFLPGCFCMYRVDLLKKMDGWDTNYKFPFFNEDTDVSVRLKAVGGCLVIVPSVKVLHKRARGGVRTKISKKVWFYNFGFNNSYYYFKNFGVFSYLLYSLFRFRDLMYVLKQLNFSIILSYFKGIKDGFKKARH